MAENAPFTARIRWHCAPSYDFERRERAKAKAAKRADKAKAKAEKKAAGTPDGERAQHAVDDMDTAIAQNKTDGGGLGRTRAQIALRGRLFACLEPRKTSLPERLLALARDSRRRAIRSSPLPAEHRLAGSHPVSKSSRTGAPRGIRTPDPRVRSPILYPAELEARRREPSRADAICQRSTTLTA